MKNSLHLKAPNNWINDPNGFIYYQGNYHLFYQYFPYGPRWGTMHWGHAISKDLVNWEHQGIALFPTIKEDQNGCFSGSAVENDGKLYIYYTGVHFLEANPKDVHVPLNDKYDACQMMITSEDGFTFDNFKGKKVAVPQIFDEEKGDPFNTRDPKVWRGKDAWYMILGSTSKEEGGRVLFYKSENLKDWTYVNQASKENKMGWMWECPDYFKTEGGEVLIISAMNIVEDGKVEPNHTICMNVEFDEETCNMKLSDTYRFMDYGLDLYAPQSTLDKEGRRTLIAWARMPEPVEGSWSGMFCMPRLVEVKDGHIYFRLHPDVKNKFQRRIISAGEADEAGYHISVTMKDGDYLDIGGYQVSRKGDKICSDKSKVFKNDRDYRLTFETPAVKDGNHVDIYVDSNLIEVYVNDGEYVITNTVYDLGKDIKTSPGLEFTMDTI